MTLPSSLPAASPETPVPSPARTPAHGANGNGAALPAPSRLPRARRGNKALWIILPLAALLFLGGPALAWFFFFRGPQVRTDLVTYKVEYKDLQLKIVERGSLEAMESHDVKCEVKTGSRGAPKIKWVVDNGKEVKKGDLLVEIDDSYILEQRDAKRIERDKAEADKIAAEQLHPVKMKAIELAKQNQEKWIKGDFLQQLHDYEGQILVAKSIVQQQQDRADWAARMVKKGYMTASQSEAELDTLKGDELDLQKKTELRKVLLEYTDPVNRKSNENAVKQAEVDERTAYATMESTAAIFKQQEDLLKDLNEQVKQCKIYAPNTGIVVYYVPEQTRMGSGATQSIVAQGEPVQFGQKMMSIPDLSHMKVNVRIHEAFYTKMKPDLPCLVRVDAVPDKMFKGHVESIANAASPQDWMSPDVKVYQAYIDIDGTVEKLKPGLSAVCTIFTDDKAEHVLAVPVQAVLSSPERGAKPRVYVLTPNGPEIREVKLGYSDDKLVQIVEGVSEGDEVVLNPRVLLNDKDKRSGGKEDEKGQQGGDKSGGKPGGKGKPGEEGAGAGMPGSGGPARSGGPGGGGRKQ